MSRSWMPGKRDCNSAMASPMVRALTSTSSSLLVSLRSGVGMRTLVAIKISSGVHRTNFICHQRFELAQARPDFARLANVAIDRVERLQSIAGDAEHGGIIRRNFTGRNELFGDAHGDAARRLGENAFGLREQPDAF